MFKHFLLPTDGSELSQKAIRAGIALAKEANARVTGFYAVQPHPARVFGESVPIEHLPPDRLDELENSRAKEHLDFIEQVAKEAGVPCQVDRATAEHPYEAIIEAAKKHGCDLIFMASHGRRGLSALLLGSETQKVLTHCTIPVLVYR